MATDGLSLLLPTPRRVTIDSPALLEVSRLTLAAPDDTRTDAAVRVLSPHLARSANTIGPTRPLALKIDRQIESPQGYCLRISSAGVTLIARDAAGLFYGAHTLSQLFKINPFALPVVTIEDWPDFPARGVMLDVSRDKVPTMDTLLRLIDLLASWKINQLQLYIEHTFAYRNHREVWRHASPFTADEIRTIDAYCLERFIDLVPNQNSFGHMERWLKHERYLPLAEAPDGSDTPWGFRWDGPFSLCPTDAQSLELLKELYAEYLPNFSSRFFNVGCDETFDIGQGRSKAACNERGVTRVYLDFLRQVQQLVKSHGRMMQFWGDIIIKHPELISELPKDVIALEWGYEANHPFDTDGEHFKNAGVPFYVCPGTSSWCTIAGRTDNALANLRSAAAAGLKHGAIGYLNTDWGDYGHLQYLPISYLPFAAGAALSWCESTNRESDFVEATSMFAFNDPTGRMGQAAYDFGNVYLVLNDRPANASKLFRFLVPGVKGLAPGRHASDQELDAAEAAIDRVLARVDAAASHPLITAEFHNAAAMLRLGCEIGRGNALSHDTINAVVAEHRRLWLARNRPGGLDDSCSRLEKLKDRTA